MYSAIHLAMIDEAGHNGIRQEHIDRLVSAIVQSGVTHIGNQEFAYFCRKCGIDPNCFTQSDIDWLGHCLNNL